jgi:transcriptional regulator with AAA-type ATPase domain
MKILLTFTGFHDPFSEGPIAGERETGPVLTVNAERHFDRVYLLSTPSTEQVTAQVQEELLKRHADRKVETCDVPLKDPTNYRGLFKQLRTHFKRINKENPEAEYFICVSSGTPHMHASWLMLAASGEIPAKILQTRALRFVPQGQTRVTEIDFTDPAFPQIKPFGPLVDEDDEGISDFQTICTELGIVGDHEAFTKPLKTAYTLAQYDSDVLLLGETGTGKEVFAQLIHHAGSRRKKPFIALNCAAIPEALFESELFGHVRGAFTGAIAERRGAFKEADGGTLFLDELGEMPVSCQAKLLRAIQSKRVQRVGESQDSPVDVRIIAATNIDVKTAIQEKKLRKDLCYRLSNVISIPPLRNRRTDIPKLAMFFLDKWNAKHAEQRRFSQEAIAALTKHSWPGNVRELEGVVTGSAQLCSGKVIRPEDLRFSDIMGSDIFDPMAEPQEGFDLNQFLDQTRDRLMKRALEKASGNRSKAAKLLNLTPQAVSQYLKARSGNED